MVLNNYTQVYDSSETSEAVIDLIVKIGVGLVGFGTLIGLIFLFKWFRKAR
jgi:hypothetical protein